MIFAAMALYVFIFYHIGFAVGSVRKHEWLAWLLVAVIFAYFGHIQFSLAIALGDKILIMFSAIAGVIIGYWVEKYGPYSELSYPDRKK